MVGFPSEINPNTNTQIQCNCTSNCCCIPFFRRRRPTHEATCEVAQEALKQQQEVNNRSQQTITQVVNKKEGKKSVF